MPQEAISSKKPHGPDQYAPDARLAAKLYLLRVPRRMRGVALEQPAAVEPAYFGLYRNRVAPSECAFGPSAGEGLGGEETRLDVIFWRRRASSSAWELSHGVKQVDLRAPGADPRAY